MVTKRHDIVSHVSLCMFTQLSLALCFQIIYVAFIIIYLIVMQMEQCV